MIFLKKLVVLSITAMTLSLVSYGQTAEVAEPEAEQPCPQGFDFTHKACKLKVKFKDEAYKDCVKIAFWKWEFGDGTRAFGKKVKHKFQFVGPYNVTLYYRDAQGNELGSVSKTIKVDN